MNRLSWVLVGALAVTLFLAWFSAELIAVRTPADTQRVIPLEPSAEDALESPVRSAECDTLKTEMDRELLGSRSCTADEDCAVLRLDCPFDCAYAVREDTFVALYNLHETYVSTCGSCQAACTSEPAPASCRAGRCILNRADLGVRPPTRPSLPPPTDDAD